MKVFGFFDFDFDLMYVDMRKVLASLKNRALYLVSNIDGVNNEYNFG
jgi:hypothetical protein